MQYLSIIIGWLLQLTLFLFTAYGVNIVFGYEAMGWLLMLASVPLSVIGYFNVQVKARV
jgi:hypothetical protein